MLINRASLSFNKYGAHKEIKSRVGPFHLAFNFILSLFIQNFNFDVFIRMAISSQFKIIHDGRVSFN